MKVYQLIEKTVDKMLMMEDSSGPEEKEVMLFLPDPGGSHIVESVFGNLYHRSPSSEFDRRILAHMKSMFTRSVKLVIQTDQVGVSVVTESNRRFIYSPANFGDHQLLWERFYSSSDTVRLFYIQMFDNTIRLKSIEYDNMYVQFDPA